MADWADEKAKVVLYYLGKCKTLEEEIELVAAHLRTVHAEGKLAASTEIKEALAPGAGTKQ